MGNDGNGKREMKKCISLKHSATELAVLGNEEPGLQASCSLATFVALLRGGLAVCDKN